GPGEPPPQDTGAAASPEPQSPYPGDYPRPYSEGRHDPFERESTAGTLRDQLYDALIAVPLSIRDRMLVTYLIDSLGADGYLRDSLDELADNDDFDPAPEESEWLTALHHVQNLLAPGIGARDLRECLLLQLRA